MIRSFLWLMMLIKTVAGHAQDYQALQGSNYAGSLGIHNNPAAAVMTPFKWDITLLGFQAKSTANLYTIYNYSLLSNPAKSQYQLNSGAGKRYAALIVNLNLLNARIAVNRKSAIGFGINIRSASNLSTSAYNFVDTLKSTGDFFKINNPANTYSGKVTSATWAEIYASYSRTLIDDDNKRINAGITLKVNKGLSGARGELFSGNFQRTADNRYVLTGASAEYLYSSNYDNWNKYNSTSTNISSFLQHTNGGISVDAGMEYVVKPNVITFFDDEDDYYDYEWKIGLSLLDAGYTQYQHGNQSRRVSNVKSGVNNLQLDNKFDSTITSVSIFNDSLATIVDNFAGLAGGFKIINPMRIVLNVDRFIIKNFFLNADLTLNIPGPALKKWYSVHEMNLLTVTPRWETARYGFYLPLQVTTTGRFWVGGAFRVGPLLFGIHNWANLFAKNTIQNGGGYIAFTIRDLTGISRKYDRRLNCPAL